MATIEDQSEASKWKMPHHQFKEGDELILTTVTGKTYIGSLCPCGDYRTTDGEHLRKSAIWRVAKLDKVLRSSGFIPPSSEMADELTARAKQEAMEELKDILQQTIMKAMAGSFFSIRGQSATGRDDLFDYQKDWLQRAQAPDGQDKRIRRNGVTVWSNPMPLPDSLRDLFDRALFMNARKSGKSALQEALFKTAKSENATFFVDEMNIKDVPGPLKEMLEEAFKNHSGRIFPFPFPLA